MRGKIILAAAMTLLSSAAHADFKIAFLDSLAGPGGPINENSLSIIQQAADLINSEGGINGEQIEIRAYDNGGTPDGTLVQMQKALDDGYRYLIVGGSSTVGAALLEGLDKYNARNPGQEAIYLNPGASAPEMTNEKCSFWHFRFAGHSGMMVNGLTTYLKNRPDIKKVYLIGQDYVTGRAIQEDSIAQLKEKRPDLEIVGRELHPLNKIQDFTPYVQKIITSGADAVITGNWGQDMVLLVKAAADSGAKMPFLTIFGGTRGTVAALGESAVDTLYYINEGTNNMELPTEQIQLVKDYKKAHPQYDYVYPRDTTMMRMVKKAAEQAGSNGPVAVAKALSGLQYDDVYGPVVMRAADHQIQTNLYMNVVAADVEFKADDTPYGWKVAEGGVIPAVGVELPTTCQMKRPD